MSGLFGSTLIKGNRLTDFAQTSAEVGIAMPWGYGMYTAPGNIIFAPLPPKEHRKVKRQGKGGVKQETFTYTLSHAVAFGCRRIYGYRWIKRNGKIVYTTDPNAPVEDQAYATKWLERATLYYGTRTQLPDSTIESYEGTGQVSAFRDVPYIVLEDDDVTDNGGAAPGYEAAVIATPPEAYLTSRPYPVQIEEQAIYGLTPTDGLLRNLVAQTNSQASQLSYGMLPTGGILRLNVVEYTAPTEEATYSSVPTSGVLKNAIKSTGAQSSQANYNAVPSAGVLHRILVQTGAQPSQSTYNLTPSGGTLS